MSHVSPEPEQIARLVADEREGPVVMLNLNRYRARAAYPDGHPDADVSGREAYRRYGAVAARALTEIGGRPLWSAPVEQVLVGCDHEAYDEVIAVWYPSRKAFLAMAQIPWYREALVHREAGMERAALIACAASAEPALRLLVDLEP